MCALWLRQGNRNPAADSLQTPPSNSENQFRLLRNQIDPPQTNNTRHDDHGQFNLIRNQISRGQSASAEQTGRSQAVDAIGFNSVHNQIYSERDRIRRNKREYKNLHSMQNQSFNSEVILKVMLRGSLNLSFRSGPFLGFFLFKGRI